jgi:ABC-2 type transport system permease protein
VSFVALWGSELRRLLARRAVRVAFAVALGLTALVVIVAAFRSTGTGPTDHTMRLRTLWLESRGHTQETTVLSVAIYLYVVAAGLAATAIGGDYRAGTVGTPLTWEPRRVRLMTARLLAIVVVAAGLYLVITGVLVGGWWIGAAARGSVSVPSHFWPDLLRLVARCLAATVGFALVTAGLVLVTRSTVGAILLWVGYLIGIEAVLAARISGLREHLVIPNLAAFLDGHPVRIGGAGSGGGVIVVGPSDGLVLLLGVVVIVVALGVVAFRRRDVA